MSNNISGKDPYTYTLKEVEQTPDKKTIRKKNFFKVFMIFFMILTLLSMAVKGI